MLLWTGQTVSILGSRISSIAFPLLVLALTSSPAKAGLAGFAATIPYLLFQLPAGALIDRWNRKRVMIACDSFRALALGSIALSAWLGALSFLQVLVIGFLEGVFFVFFNLAQRAALPNVVPPAQLPAAIAQNEASGRGSSLAGQPLGGIFFGLHKALPFVIDAVSYIFSVVTLMFIKTPLQGDQVRSSTKLQQEIGEGLRWLWNQPFLRAAALLVGGSNLIFQALVLVVIVLAEDLGASPGLIGVILGFLGGGGLLGTLVASPVQKRVHAKVIVIGANWVWAILLPVLAFIKNPLALGPVLGAIAFVGPAWNVAVGTYQLILTPDNLRGRVGSVSMLIAWGVIPFGSLVGGFLLERFGAITTILLLSGGHASDCRRRHF
ncbi:MAG TPA: MFS transporter [bacterium]|nr:MFS transporter [bacterium]